MLKQTGEAEKLTAELVWRLLQTQGCSNQLGDIPWLSTVKAVCYLKIRL